MTATVSEFERYSEEYKYMGSYGRRGSLDGADKSPKTWHMIWNLAMVQEKTFELKAKWEDLCFFFN